MTFYWWSHWFWITFSCYLIFPQIVVVNTYPSKETIKEYNHNADNNSKNLVTKLYHTTTLGTTESTIFTKSTTTEEKLIHEETETDNNSHTSLFNYDDYYEEETTVDNVNQRINLEQMEADLENKEKHVISLNKDISENDVKRSAEIVNRPKNKLSVTPATLPVIAAEANNYTNFTEQTLALSTNTTTTATTLNTTKNTTTTATTTTNNTNSTSDSNDNNNNTPTITTQISTYETGLVNDTTTLLPQAPETPKIVKAQMGNLDWLNTVPAQLPPAHLTTDDGVHEYPEKVPFTLENANKAEDLRREETEHRTRKSKGLSADYKVNRYINYSSDSKNHLTRSTTEFEEPNISSERLSVQPAYFKDVGAISAICFTVFGICCTVGTVGIVLYRRRFLNKPQALSEPDSSVYIDDSTMRVSDNSDEMYSLDNDSFLNSLEAMTIQNYWTDTVKHTKL